MKRLQVDLLEGSITKGILLFAMPILLSNIFQQLYNTIDTIVVGHYLGDLSLAAVGASFAVFTLIIGFTLGMGNGMSLVVARSYGNGDVDLLKKSVASALVVGLVTIMTMMLLSYFFLWDLLVLLRTPSEIIDDAYTYISIITTFMGITFLYNLLAGLYRAVGNSFTPLLFLILSSLINIGLDILFIVYFKMGIEGVAIATVIAQSISAVLSLIYMVIRLPLLIPKIKHFKVDLHMYKEVAGQGLSMALMYSLIFIGSLVLQYAINNMGYLIIAGHTTARRVNSLFMMPVGTVSTAISTLVSQNKGAGNKERIIKGVKTGIILIWVWSFTAFILNLFLAATLVESISGSDSPLVINTATRYLMWNIPFHFILAPLFVLRFTLQGLGEKLIPLVSSCIEMVLKIVFVIWFIPIFGYFAVIISEPVIWVFMTIQLFYAYRHNRYLFPSAA